jgi:hypothetical protein
MNGKKSEKLLIAFHPSSLIPHPCFSWRKSRRAAKLPQLEMLHLQESSKYINTSLARALPTVKLANCAPECGAWKIFEKWTNVLRANDFDGSGNRRARPSGGAARRPASA